jgi:hypothetical protein
MQTLQRLNDLASRFQIPTVMPTAEQSSPAAPASETTTAQVEPPAQTKQAPTESQVDIQPMTPFLNMPTPNYGPDFASMTAAFGKHPDASPPMSGPASANKSPAGPASPYPLISPNGSLSSLSPKSPFGGPELLDFRHDESNPTHHNEQASPNTAGLDIGMMSTSDEIKNDDADTPKKRSFKDKIAPITIPPLTILHPMPPPPALTPGLHVDRQSLAGYPELKTPLGPPNSLMTPSGFSDWMASWPQPSPGLPLPSPGLPLQSPLLTPSAFPALYNMLSSPKS